MPWFRRFALTASLACLVKTVWIGADLWSLSVFFLGLAAWYWAGRRLVRHLDSPRPR